MLTPHPTSARLVSFDAVLMMCEMFTFMWTSLNFGVLTITLVQVRVLRLVSFVLPLVSPTLARFSALLLQMVAHAYNSHATSSPHSPHASPDSSSACR